MGLWELMDNMSRQTLMKAQTLSTRADTQALYHAMGCSFQAGIQMGHSRIGAPGA